MSNAHPFDAIQNKTVVVFGASKGIGYASAHRFVTLGANVVLASRNINLLRKHVSELNNGKGLAHAVYCDVSDYNSVYEVVSYAQTLGKIDYVVNSAGTIEPLTHLIESDPTLWGQAIDINFKGAYNVIRALSPVMKEQGFGTIISLSSGAANSILEGWSHYCSTKAGVKKLTEVAHKELNEYGIKVIGLSPGTVATEMMKKIRDADINPVSRLDWSTHIPADWAAQAIVFLCGPEGKQFAGTDFSIKTDEGRKLVGLH